MNNWQMYSMFTLKNN